MRMKLLSQYVHISYQYLADDLLIKVFNSILFQELVYDRFINVHHNSSCRMLVYYHFINVYHSISFLELFDDHTIMNRNVFFRVHLAMSSRYLTKVALRLPIHLQKESP